MQHKGRDANLSQQRAHIRIASRNQGAHRLFGGYRDAFQLIEPVGLLLGRVWHELRRPKLAERWGLLAPAEAHQAQHRRALLLFRGPPRTFRPTDRVPAEQDQMGDALRMAHRVADRYRTSLRDAEEGEALESRGIHNGLQIADKRLERNLFNVAVRQAVAACVVADQRMVT